MSLAVQTTVMLATLCLVIIPGCGKMSSRAAAEELLRDDPFRQIDAEKANELVESEMYTMCSMDE